MKQVGMKELNYDELLLVQGGTNWGQVIGGNMMVAGGVMTTNPWLVTSGVISTYSGISDEF